MDNKNTARAVDINCSLVAENKMAMRTNGLTSKNGRGVLASTGGMLSKPYIVLIILLLTVLGVALGYLFKNLGLRPDIIFPNRLTTVIAIVIVSIAVGISTILFQTVANSRILSPGVLGLENIYTFIQASIIFFLGTNSYVITSTTNFLLSIAIMIGFSLLLFLPLLSKRTRGIFFVLLLGLIIGQMFSSMTTYMAYFFSPDEYEMMQSRIFASFEFPNMNLVIATSVALAISIVFIPRPKTLDVISLGRDAAIGLGVNYKLQCIRILIIVSVLVATSTVTVGPVMFLGVLVANLSYRIMKTYRHIYLMPCCILLTATMILSTQYFYKHIRNFGVSLSVMINFVGGIFFLYLLLKERKKSV